MTPTPTSQASLLFRLRDSQDLEAWVEFVEIYEPVIYRQLPVASRQLQKCGLLDADARELMQEFLIAVSRRIEHWEFAKERGSFRGTSVLTLEWPQARQQGRPVSF